ncbi:hypothetical protein Csa_000258 [Cucumis sativus]|uniref:Uncharacterized protein n=1 Tax=Cucumis sativus TaxID=3659 RepID=A0A0A0KKY5_CUCSA|nr:hypothetical protein Csa_000258 [Cucumis sativus]
MGKQHLSDHGDDQLLASKILWRNILLPLQVRFLEITILKQNYLELLAVSF